MPWKRHVTYNHMPKGYRVVLMFVLRVGYITFRRWIAPLRQVIGQKETRGLYLELFSIWNLIWITYVYLATHLCRLCPCSRWGCSTPASSLAGKCPHTGECPTLSAVYTWHTWHHWSCGCHTWGSSSPRRIPLQQHQLCFRQLRYAT